MNKVTNEHILYQHDQNLPYAEGSMTAHGASISYLSGVNPNFWVPLSEWCLLST